MNAPPSATQPSPHVVVLTLARLLERLEQVPVDAGQYQVVVARLSAALQDAAPDAALRTVLDTHPAAAELYENLHYRHAGLCRSPLDAALSAERDAVAAITKAAGGTAARPKR